jgi:hypothetical protein
VRHASFKGAYFTIVDGSVQYDACAHSVIILPRMRILGIVDEPSNREIAVCRIMVGDCGILFEATWMFKSSQL